jgi:hypothetical protein
MREEIEEMDVNLIRYNVQNESEGFIKSIHDIDPNYNHDIPVSEPEDDPSSPSKANSSVAVSTAANRKKSSDANSTSNQTAELKKQNGLKTKKSVTMNINDPNNINNSNSKLTNIDENQAAGQPTNNDSNNINNHPAVATVESSGCNCIKVFNWNKFNKKNTVKPDW